MFSDTVVKESTQV